MTVLGKLLLAAAIICVPLHLAFASNTIPFARASADSSDGSVITVNWDAPDIRHVTVLISQDGRTFSATSRYEGKGTDHVTLRLPPAVRWYFKLVPDHGDPLVISDRSLHLSSVANFRDVGGYRTLDGHWVRMGVAYRSNALNAMTPADMKRAEMLGIKLVVDLRMDVERAHAPDVSIAPQISDNVLADKQAKFGATAKDPPPASGEAASELVKKAYRDFVDLPSARVAYHNLFERLSDPASLPTVFHCTAGKDRTGWAQAVLLTILGVSRPTIATDYELTDRYLAPQAGLVARTFAQGTAPVAAQTMMRADPAYLDAAFAEVATQYGSFDNYLRRGLHLDDKTLAAIRKNFLSE